jgi:hypothetical protein
VFATLSWPENKLTSLMTKRLNEKEFNNQEWYDYLNSNPLYFEKYLRQKIKESSYIDKVKNELGQEYLVLLTHPGLLSRIDHFIVFAKNHMTNTSNIIPPHQLYQIYSDHLGKIKLFRGMSLENDQMAQEIVSQGITANLIRQSPNQGASIFVQEFMQTYPGRVRPYLLELHQHIRGGADTSRYISTSHYIEVAASVGFYRNPRLGPPVNQRLYLYEMEIPRIEVIEFKEYFKELGSSQIGYFTINEKQFHFNDPQVEYLVPYFIKNDWIVKVHRYENPPPPWRYFR